MSRYEPLKRFLESIQPAVNMQSLTFEEIERIIGLKLPRSAYDQRPWWSNPKSPADHPHAQSWLEAGWVVDSVNQQEKWVNFRRKASINTEKVGKSADDPYIYPKVIEQNIGIAQPIVKNHQLLIMLGFEVVGEWLLERNSLQFRLEKNENERNILYAFVVQESVEYIGKSTMTLSKRMNGYRNPGPTQTTNIRNNARISDLLRQGVPVQIFVLVPREEIFYKGFPVNIAAGLEDNLLARIRPPWNNIK